MTLKTAERTQINGEKIIKIASSFTHVVQGTPVYALLDELYEPVRNAIAVTDADGVVQGTIIPNDLVEILGKPFGRDLLKRQFVEDIMRPAFTFRYDDYIQDVRERLAGDFETGADGYYVLVDADGIFRGHVSSRDILVHTMNDHARELETGATIQSRLVPPCLDIQGKRLSITCSSVMAQGVGGDYYYVREYRPGKWFFCLCDISGKGISAAIITAVLAGFMYNADFSQPIEDTVIRLNRIMLDTFRLKKYLTGIFMKFDEESGELTWCDMGHSFFFVIEGSSVQQLSEQADNVPVGLIEDPFPVAKTLRVMPGTIFLLVSDGIIEQENRQGESFDINEIGIITDECARKANDPIRAKVRILERFFDFKRDMPQRDDISMLLFNYRES
ncbi:MAG: CBS domain-containing protein [Treponema sp.]|jgi:sigma-B regulation protein RsbU (phosphoserine phosphatase)|nr:MAG: CBS domain-containing protein [Treponema sp.]HQL32785.1 PP2C family protein-serine/threonine phosphatase [Treponemataceae bacterium]